MSPKDMKAFAWQREFDLVDDEVGGRLHLRERARSTAMTRAGASVLMPSARSGCTAEHGLALPPHPLTRHAAHRLKNRGITPQQLQLVTDFGTAQRAHGATRYALDRRARQLIQHTLPPEQLRNLKSLDIVAVVADDGAVITVAHRTQRLRRDIHH